MKKFTFLCIFALLLAGGIFAESYDLQVAGIKVTSDNCNDILKDGGSVTYNPSTLTLTLNNTNFETQVTEMNAGIHSRINNLKIVIKGTNTIKVKTEGYMSMGISISRDCTIVPGSSNAVLNIQGTTSGNHDVGQGMRFFNNTTTLIDGGTLGLTINIEKAYRNGFEGNMDCTSSVILKNVNVNISAADGKMTDATICELKNLTLDGCEIVSPSGLTFDASKNALVDKYGEIHTGSLKIEKIKSTPYSVYVKGDNVNSYNCNDILKDGGSVSYNEATKTLTLKNAHITNEDDAINFYAAGMTLNLVGTNSIDVTGGLAYALSAEDGLDITGSGTLAITSKNVGIYSNGLSLSGGCTVDVTAKVYGLTCLGDQLSIDNSTLFAQGGEMSILGVNSLVLVGVEILSNHTYNATSHYFYDADSNFATDKVIIGKIIGYPVYVQDTNVDSKNCTDVLNDGGSVTYNAATQTLTLNNANLSMNGDVINLYDSGTTINLVGTNTIIVTHSDIYGTNVNAISALEGFNVTGSGTLNIVSEGTGIWVGKSLNISGGCTIDIKAGTYGVVVAADELIVNKSTLLSQGNNSSILGVSSLTLIDCYIKSNHTYDAATSTFRDENGNDAKNQICIVPTEIYRLWIAGMPVSSANCGDVLEDGSSVVYDHATRTLYLNNINIDVPKNVNGISSSIDNLKIVVLGNNTITTTTGSVWAIGIELLSSSSIVAGSPDAVLNIQGKADVEKGLGYGILAENGIVTIDGGTSGLTLNINRPENRGLCGYNNNTSYTLKNVNINITAPEKGMYEGAIFDVEGMSMKNCHIVSPAGAKFDAEQRAVVDAEGNVVRSSLKIEAGAGSAVEMVDNAQCPMHKFVRDGQVYIVRDGRTYNVLGTEVR